MEKETDIINKLASSLKRRDEAPNLELAKAIADAQDTDSVKELVENLSNKKAIQNDCIKVLYEIGEQAPKLIAPYIPEFVSQLNSKNNRLQWGAMTALESVTIESPKDIYRALPAILLAADKGSVITKDRAVNILIKLCSFENYAEQTFTLLIEQLLKSPVNQVPMYAERAAPIIHTKNKTTFVETLRSRLDDIEKESKRKRVEKIIQKFK